MDERVQIGVSGAWVDPAAARILRRSTIHAGNKYAYEDVVLRAQDGARCTVRWFATRARGGGSGFSTRRTGRGC